MSSEITEAMIDAAIHGWHKSLITAPDESVEDRRRRCIRAALEAALAARPAPEAGSEAELVRSSLQFCVWAAGEGIAPGDKWCEGPEEFLFTYSQIVNDDDWDGLPNRVAAAIAECEEQNERLEKALRAMLKEHEILSGNYGDVMDPKHVSPDRWPSAASLARAALQQEGE